MDADRTRYPFRPDGLRATVVIFGVFTGFGLITAYMMAAFLPGFLARFEPQRLGDIPLSVWVPMIGAILAVAAFLRMVARQVLEAVKLLRSGHLAAAAVTLDITGITLDEGDTTIRFDWHDFDLVTSDVAHFFPVQKLGRDPVRALVLRPRDTGTARAATPGYRTKVAYFRAIINDPRHIFGAFALRGLIIVPLAQMDRADAAALCEKAEAMHQDATGGRGPSLPEPGNRQAPT